MVVQASNHIKTAAHARGGVPKCPCDNVSRWAMEPADKITGISIGAASCVNSIKITFDIDGTTRVTPRYGGPGGELFQACLSDLHPSMHLFFCLPLPSTNTYYQIYKSLNFTLMQDEYLTSVSGYVKYDCSEFPCVSQLTFTTNLGKTYGPYGGGGGTFFEVNVEYDEIKGFFGQATTEYLTAFGVYSNKHNNIILSLTTNVCMPLQHQSMYFLIRLPPANRYTIAKCIIVLIALQITLMQDEYLTSVSGYVRHICSDLPCISQLMFGTNLGRTHGPYGGGGGTFFEVNVEYDDIKGFFGYATTEHLTVFGVYIVNTLHKGWLSQHHVDSKCSEILFSCMTKEALNLVIFYIDLEKGSTPTSIWTVCLCKIGGKRELRYTWKFRTVVFDIPRNGGEVLVGGRGRQKNRCMDRWRSERHAWNSSPPEPPYLGVTRVVPSMSKVILMEFMHEAAPMLMPVILSAGSMAQRDSLPHGRLGTPPRACAAVLIWLEACTTMHHPSQTT
ncbi:unnamed protein product [Musa banksii]